MTTIAAPGHVLPGATPSTTTSRPHTHLYCRALMNFFIRDMMNMRLVLQFISRQASQLMLRLG